MFPSLLRASRQIPRRVKPVIANVQLRQTASKAVLASTAAEDFSSNRTLLVGGLVAAAAAASAGLFAYDQQQKTADCCGIIGVVAHPKFDVR